MRDKSVLIMNFIDSFVHISFIQYFTGNQSNFINVGCVCIVYCFQLFIFVITTAKIYSTRNVADLVKHIIYK